MKKLLILLAMIMSLCLGTGADGEEYQSNVIHVPVPRTVEGETVSPNSEHFHALHFLKYFVFEDDRKDIVFWSLYDVPPELLDSGERLLTASILSHSAGNRPAVARLVPGSKTLFYGNIRDYNWNREAWEIIALQDPYFREPWINNVDAAELRLIGGNSIVSGSWFIANILDYMKPEDVGLEPIGPILLYSNLGGPPKTLAEFRAIWGVNDKRVNIFGQAIGTIIPRGQSAVSRNERQIAVTGTDLGYYAETNDNKNGLRRYIDNLDPVLSRPDRDASEAIASNGVQWQAYWLAAFGNGKAANEQAVNFGDPTVVVDTSGQSDDVRVRMIVSCMSCHATGLNTAPNRLSELLGKKISLNFEDKKELDRHASFYLRNFNKKVEFYRILYTDAVKRDTGWEPNELVANLHKFLNWYDAPLDLEQAARTSGVTIDAYQYHTKGSANATLTGLHRGFAVPRDAWEIGDSSVFVESMLLIYRSKLVKIKEVVVKEKVQQHRQKVWFTATWYNGMKFQSYQAKTTQDYVVSGSIVIPRGSTVYIYSEGTTENGVFYGSLNHLKAVLVPKHILETIWAN
jgi:hypothetical protein